MNNEGQIIEIPSTEPVVDQPVPVIGVNSSPVAVPTVVEGIVEEIIEIKEEPVEIPAPISTVSAEMPSPVVISTASPIEVAPVSQVVEIPSTVSIPAQVEIPAVPVVEQPTVMSMPVAQAVPIMEQPVAPAIEPMVAQPAVMPIVAEPVVGTSEPVAPIVNEPIPNLVETSPKKKKSKVGLIIVILLLIVLVVAGVYFLVINKSEKMVLARSLKQLEGFVDRNVAMEYKLPHFEEYEQLGTLSYNISGAALEADPATKAIFEVVNKLSINYDIIRKKDMFYLGLDIKDKNKSLIDLKFHSKGDKTHFIVEKLFKQYIELDLATEILTEDNYISPEDYEYVYNFVLKSFATNLDESYFEESKATIKLDGKAVEADKLSLSLDKKRIMDLFTKILKDIKSDDKAVSIIEKFYKDVKKYEPKKSESDIETKLNYNIYMTGLLGKVVGVDLELLTKVPSNEFNDSDVKKKEWNGPIFEYRLESKETIYIKNNDELVKIEFKKEDGKFTAKVFDNENTEMLDLLIENPDESTLKLTAKITAGTEIIKFGMDIKTKEQSKDKEYSFDTTLMFEYENDGVELFKLSGTEKSTLKDMKSETPKIDFNVTSSKKIDEITTEEMMKVMHNVEGILLELMGPSFFGMNPAQTTY